MKTKTLAQRIALVILLPLLLALLAIGALLLRRHAEDVQTQRLDSARATIGQLAALAELPLATGSRTGIRETANFIQRTANPLGLALFDRDGNAVETRGNVGSYALKAVSGRPLNAQVELHEQTLELVQPVFLAAVSVSEETKDRRSTASLVGYVTLAFSNENQKLALRRLWVNGLAVLVIAGLLSYFFAYRLLRGVTRPLAQLNTAFDRMRAGDLDARMERTGVDDLQRLAASFNSMAVELKSARTNLRSEVESATAALAKRTAEAESANQAKSRFLAAASHDLRQPAHALSLYTSALRNIARQQPDEIRTAIAPAIEGMQTAAKSLDALLDALLDMSRFDAGVVQVSRTTVVLDELIRDALTVLDSSARQRGVALASRVGHLDIDTDATLLRRIVDNLVSNAIRYTRSGRILVSVRPRFNHTLLQVWDQGIGIDPADQAKIFEEFFQVKRGEAIQSGMGLGLAIVARSVKLLGGEIWVRSVVDRGSCFSVRLPSASRIRLLNPASLSSGATMSAGYALILDDDPMVRDSMSAWFASQGLKPIAQAALPELLAACEGKTQIAAAVVDYRLGDGFTGIDAARHLRIRFGDTIPIVMITGDTSVERLQLLQASGFPVEHKPISHERLQLAISPLVQKCWATR
jgi:two-component system, sensor histidine kinase